MDYAETFSRENPWYAFTSNTPLLISHFPDPEDDYSLPKGSFLLQIKENGQLVDSFIFDSALYFFFILHHLKTTKKALESCAAKKRRKNLLCRDWALKFRIDTSSLMLLAHTDLRQKIFLSMTWNDEDWLDVWKRFSNLRRITTLLIVPYWARHTQTWKSIELWIFIVKVHFSFKKIFLFHSACRFTVHALLLISPKKKIRRNWFWFELPIAATIRNLEHCTEENVAVSLKKFCKFETG